MSESSRMTTRKCEMEAGYESQHRTQVNLGTGYVGWASVRRITTPDIRSFPAFGYPKRTEANGD